MARRDWKSFISLLLVLMQAVSVLPAVSEGGSITLFSDGGAVAEAQLAAGGNITFANISIPFSSVMLGGKVQISPRAAPDGYPLNPSVDLCADGSPEWAFTGTGYGNLGKQTLFSEGAMEQDFRFSAPGTVTVNLTLPKNATVTRAGLELTGIAGQRWWNSSWRNRLPLSVTELAGKDQTDFVVETLLDTRNWSVKSAENEFRVTLRNETTLNETEVPMQVVDEIDNGSKCLEAALLFAVQDLKANGTQGYYLYFNNPGAVTRSPLYGDFNPRLIRNRLSPQTIGDQNSSGLLAPGGSNSAFDTPHGVAADASGRIYVSDTNNQRVQIFNALGDHFKTIGVTGVNGSDNSHFYYPRGLDVATDGKLLVADGGCFTFPIVTSNHRVMIFNDLNDGTADSMLGITGQYGNDVTHLNGPWDVSVNPNGRLAVADTGYMVPLFPNPPTYGQRVQVYKDLADTTADDTCGVAGVVGSDSTHLNWPDGVGISDDGAIYVADSGNNRMVLFKNDGDHVADMMINPSGIPGAGNDQLRRPLDVDADSKGNVYVSDTYNHRVQVYDRNGLFKYTIGETGVSRTDAFHLNTPAGIHIGDDDKIYIADSLNHRVMRITPGNLTVGSPETLAIPEDLTIDLGADGSIDWSRSGVLDGAVNTDALADPMNAMLANLTGVRDAYGNLMVRSPVKIGNAGLGLLAVGGISVEYGYMFELAYPAAALEPYVNVASHANATGIVTVPVSFGADSPGGIRLSGLDLSVDFAPAILSPIPDFSIAEDTADRALCDLTDYFRDDIDVPLNFTLVNVTNSSIAKVGIVNGSVLSVDCTFPSARDWSGIINMVVRATDPRGLTAVSNQFHVTVQPVNDAPFITSSPPLSATVGEDWAYQVNATDVENATLNFILEKRPAGMTIDRAAGLVLWTPAQNQEGAGEVLLIVSDGELATQQDFRINVTRPARPNHPPKISSEPLTVAEVGKRYTYSVEALDEDNDTLSFSLDRAPANMTIRNATGDIDWTPTEAQKGSNEVIVRVSDSKVHITQAFNVTVYSDLSKVMPTVKITEPAPYSKISGKVWLKGTAAAMGNATIVAISISSDGRLSWQPAEVRGSWAYQLDTRNLSNGMSKIFVRVKDNALRETEANITLNVQNAAPSAPSGGFLGLDPFLWIFLIVIICAAVGAGAYAMTRRRKVSPPDRASSAPMVASSQAPAGAAPMPRAPPPPLPKLAAKPSAPPARPVDSVFLIYHDGRLITYFSRSESMKLDDTLDMIRRFVKASFSGQLGRLDAMSYENMNIIMERGNLMYMVVITPLNTYDDLRHQMRHLLNDIDNKYRLVFKIWDGDFGKVKGVKSMVERFAGEEVWEMPDEPPVPKEGTAPRKAAGGRRIAIRPLIASPPQAAPMAIPSPAPDQGAPARPPIEPPSGAAGSSAPTAPPHQDPQMEPGAPPGKTTRYARTHEEPPGTSAAAGSPAEPPKTSALPLRPVGPPKTAAPSLRTVEHSEKAGPPQQPIAPPKSAGPTSNPPESTPAAGAAAQQKPISPEANPPKAGNSEDIEGLSRERRLALLEDKFLMGEITEATYRELKGKYSKTR